jgi:hypothetical protein
MADFRFYNVIFFSVLSSLYNISQTGSSTFLSDGDLPIAFLETEDDFENRIPELSYYNIFVAQSPSGEKKRVKEFRDLNTEHPISRFYSEIEKRSLATCTHLYVTPIVNKISLEGRVKLRKTASAQYVKQVVNNNIYSFLDINNDFNKEVLLSNIIGIIEENVDVVNVPGINFQAVEPTPFYTSAGLTTRQIFSTDYATWKSIVEPNIEGFLTDSDFQEKRNVILLALWDGLISSVQFPKLTYQIETLTYRKLYDAFKDVQNTTYWVGGGLAGLETTKEYQDIVYSIVNDLSPYIIQNSIDDEGNITKYSIGSEISQIRINLTYGY